MKNRVLFLVVLLMPAWAAYSFSASALQLVTQESTVTLYSTIKHRGEGLRSCINFQPGPPGMAMAGCDLRYGALYAGDDLDWFESATAQGSRSVIKDLGAHEWSSEFEVPFVEPLAKLKPDEQRHITIDTSGADGADGAPGAPGRSAKLDSAERVSSNVLPPIGNEPGRGEFGTPPPPAIQPALESRPKRDGKPRIDPSFVKAVVSHVYVIHVVDDSRDFYALFRVEALERGDRCTLSWKLIPEPGVRSGKRVW